MARAVPALVLAVAGFSTLSLLPTPTAAAKEVVGGAKVYKTAVPSVVWIHSTRPRGYATGSGSLIDRERRLVLTNYHVVEENPKATIFFPVLRDGQPVAERTYYSERANRLGIPGKVIALDKDADLAIIQIGKVPDEAKGIPLATSSPDPGDNVHSIGNAGKSGALFGYVKGTVRQLYRKKWKAELAKGKIVNFEAKVIETDSPTNPGDSGGPLLNDAGELVGVTQGGAINANSVSTFIDLSEVKKLLETKEVKAIKGKEQPPDLDIPAVIPPNFFDPKTKPTVPRRETPLTVTDSAKLFSPDAVKAANTAIAELFKKDLDVLIETYPAAPAEWIEKAKAASPSDRLKLFREWAEARLKAEKAQGLAFTVCMDPRFITIELTGTTRERFPADFAKKLGEAVRKPLSEKRYDDALTEAVKTIQMELKVKK